jgi:hypothetical protein
MLFVLSLFLTTKAMGAVGEVIPRPAEVRELPGTCTITDSTVARSEENADDIHVVVEQINAFIHKGPSLKPGLTFNGPMAPMILLTTKKPIHPWAMKDTSLRSILSQLSLAPGSQRVCSTAFRRFGSCCQQSRKSRFPRRRDGQSPVWK